MKRLKRATDRVLSFRDRGLSLAEAATLFLIVFLPLSAYAGVFTGVAGFLSSDAIVYERSVTNTGASDVKLLSARTSPDGKNNQGGGDLIYEEGALLSGGPFNTDTSVVNPSGEISVHIVRECTPERCETLSHIADMYGVSINTILWANDIKDPKLIRAGDQLVILPITGIRHIVKEKETIASIAKKYGAENTEQAEAMVNDILAYNRLASAADISVGDTIVVPGGVMHTAPATPQKKGKTPTKTASGGSSTNSGGFTHPVPGAVRTQGIHGYNAVDLAAQSGTPIRAAASGAVIVSKTGGWNGGYGNYIVVKHANGVQTLYAHTSGNDVSVGDLVDAGETIGYVGTSGKSTGSHLHFEVRGASNPF
ncbi:hypothetical protein A2392_02180 [Candidatus Kaiserbacteria bacterium RIFOXYB1_FULL_46_14]|uniref:LysM domain-containing protein n=1 Tax=Candidatus Kaiserbacteria bacterium RIFOXYB1_FULL_46_14 TaxID=1798531 RepID=A0A1F6FI84_9BACT|nr:MAG: hypothetical protein A2392_02180 [Candidatus Kaiserbacteria bacterium RIFOXYB1_FULL_46_14]